MQLPLYDPRTFGVTVGLRALRVHPRDRVNITNAPKQIKMRRVIDYDRCTPRKLTFDSDSDDSDEEDHLSCSQVSNDSGYSESSQDSSNFDTYSQSSRLSLETSFSSQDSCFHLNNSMETWQDSDFLEDVSLAENSCLDVTVAASNTENGNKSLSTAVIHDSSTKLFL